MPFKKSFCRLAVLTAFALLPMAAQAGPGDPAENIYKPRPDIFLLQPIEDGVGTVSNNGTIDTAFEYFNMIWPWLFGSAAGVAVIWAMIAGIMIMSSGENSDLRQKGKDHLMTVAKGLVLIALSGLVLTTLNSLAFS